jgi:hypothetical protein
MENLKIMNDNIDNLDNLINAAVSTTETLRDPVSMESIILMAMGKKEIPTVLDSGVKEILESMKEVVKETEMDSSHLDPLDKFVEFISLSVGKGISYLTSSFSLNQCQFSTVRGEEKSAAQGYEGTTSYGTSFSIVQTVSGSPQLALSWIDNFDSSSENKVPQRVQFHKNGRLVDSVPVEENSVKFNLKGEGRFVVSSSINNKIVEEFSISMDSNLLD